MVRYIVRTRVRGTAAGVAVLERLGHSHVRFLNWPALNMWGHLIEVAENSVLSRIMEEVADVIDVHPEVTHSIPPQELASSHIQVGSKGSGGWRSKLSGKPVSAQVNVTLDDEMRDIDFPKCGQIPCSTADGAL